MTRSLLDGPTLLPQIITFIAYGNRKEFKFFYKLYTFCISLKLFSNLKSLKREIQVFIQNKLNKLSSFERIAFNEA